MNMIPAVPHGTHSRAEKRVFDQLRLVFDDYSFTAFHSLNLTRHAYKRFGEIDFLIMSPYGLIVLEVKGGGIRCQNGLWYYSNRYGEENTSPEGPFKQAESALHALVENLKSNLPEKITSQIAIGYGVVFPDCEWSARGAEWDHHVLLDAKHFNGFARWLKKLIDYWRAKDSRSREMDHAALKALKHYLRPEFEAVVPLHVSVSNTEEQIARLTEDQMAAVDIIAANSRVLCSGGAGTGKTFLALEIARRWSADGHRVLLACRSPWLKRYLESRFVIPGLVVSLAASSESAVRRAGLSYFDALIVDEGQDLMDMESLDRLDNVLKGGLACGRWCYFYDINNQAGLLGEPEPDALQFLESCNPTKIPLRTNCRNTRIILEKVQTSLGADMGIRGAGDGPSVREHTAISREDAALILACELDEITDKGGLAHSCITILSHLPFESSFASLLPEITRTGIQVLDEFSMRSFPPNKISFTQIANFKGLENEAIIVLDLPRPSSGNQFSSLHYVAMSRARALLSMIITQ
ncbi:MAG: NERD domain-containing protein [Desulfuromonadaceae bacterium]